MTLPATILAQGIGETTGTLAGTVSEDSGAPLPGVAVTVTGGAGSKVASTGAEGRFVFPYLTPGAYSVRAELDGWKTVEQSDVRIKLNERTSLEFAMYLAVTETMEVAGDLPLIDTKSTTTGSNIPQTLIASLPIARSFTAAINLSPGVSDAGVGGNLSISGASGLENTYIIDGVNITDTGYGAVGAYSRKFGSMGSGFPPDIMQEVQVMTGGFEPEYGQALGGVVNVITKTGGNRFIGEAFAYYAPEELASERTQLEFEEVLAVNKSDEESVDGGVHLGGPILADRLFFFASYNRKREEFSYVNDPEAPYSAEFPGTTNVRTTNSYAAKLTSSLGSSHNVELSLFGDPAQSDLANQNGFGLESLDPAGKQSLLDYGGASQVLRWSGVFGANMFAEAQAARSENSFAEILGPAADRHRVIDRTVRPALTGGGLGSFDAGSDGENLQYSVKVTNIWGPHEIRYGAQYEDIDYAGGIDISGPGFLVSDGAHTSTGASVTVYPGATFDLPVEKVYAAFGWLTPALVSTTTEYLNLFAQDSWNVTPHLNLRFGVRWEEQRIKGDRAGSEDVTFGDNWAPRIGLTWDYRHDGRSKAFLHYGRFFEKIPNDLAVRSLTPVNGVFNLFYDLELTRPIPGQEEIGIGTPAEIEGLGSSTSPFTTKSQYTDEWVAGVEQEIGRDFSLGGRFIYRKVGRVIEDIGLNFDLPCIPGYLGTDLCVPAGLTAEDSLSYESGGYLITNVDGHYPGFPKLEREYKALEITAQKRYADRWQLLGSYRYARLEGNYEGLFRRDNGQSDPNITSLVDFAESPWLASTFESGPLPNDVRHAVKLFASYDFELGLNTGLAFNYSSGRPLTELGAVPFYGSRERVITPRGSFGLGDDIVTLDVRAEYELRLGGSRAISFGVDVFNVFDAQGATDVVPNSEIDNRTFEPDPNADFLKPAAYQNPRTTRFVIRYSF
jgi:hypothetical protein